jgi:hypothetical protein
VLTRKFLNGQNVDTYNVYDNEGQLVAKHAQMNRSVKKAVANKAKTPLRVVSAAAQNRISNMAKDKTDAANRQ